MAIPVILDTDIGDDIDDTWALAMLLKSPELDLKLAVGDTGDTLRRAKLLARLLEIAGRSDVPVGVGVPLARTPLPQAAWIEGYDLARYPGRVCEDGVGAIVEVIMESPQPVTLIAIGPVPNIAAALQREPRIAERARFVGMHGSLRRGYDGSAPPVPEYNVVQYPHACQMVFAAPWRDVTITPLDTCGLVRLGGEQYRAVRDCPDPLIQALLENYRIWAQNSPWGAHVDAAAHSTTLFDTVAVYLAFSEELLVMEELGVRVTDDGYTMPDTQAKRIRCATEWRDRRAFEELLTRRLTGA